MQYEKVWRITPPINIDDPRIGSFVVHSLHQSPLGEQVAVTIIDVGDTLLPLNDVVLVLSERRVSLTYHQALMLGMEQHAHD